MGAIAEGDLKARVPIYSEDEIGRVSRSFNIMAGKLETMIDDHIFHFKSSLIPVLLNDQILFHNADLLIYRVEHFGHLDPQPVAQHLDHGLIDDDHILDQRRGRERKYF